MNQEANITRYDLLRYGSLALPLAFAGMPLYIHAPDFYATHYGISLSTLGIILLAIRGFDAIQDPFIGVVSDHYVSHRLTVILVGILLLAVSFYMLFHPLEYYTVAWFAVSMIIATTAFSILSINLNALGGTWTKNVHEKTRITSYREAIGLVGLLLASILPSVLQNMYSAKLAFHLLTLVFIAVVGLATFSFVTWMFKHHELQIKEKQNLLNSFTSHHRNFFIIYGISMLASAIPAVLVIFFIRDRLGAEEYIGVFLLLYFLSGVMGMPLWQKLSKMYGKQEAWAFSMLLAIATFIWAFLLNEGDLWQYAIVCITSGMALGAELALPPSILADLIAEKKAQGNASGHFSVLTFLAKAALAVASGITFSLLDIYGYKPAQENDESALLSLSISYALIPCIIKCFSAMALWRWMQSYKQGGLYESPASNNRSFDNV